MNVERFLNSLITIISTFGLRLICALAVLIAGLKLIKWLRKKLPTFRTLGNVDAGVRTFLSSALAVGLYVLLGVGVAMILGIPTTSFIAAIASCLAAIGLAMQGSLSNFAGGLMLLIFQPFRVGDYISAPEQNVEGTVTQITVVYTVMRTYDNIEVTIPNGTLTNTVVKNLTAADTRRLDLTFRTDPGCPLEKTEAILREVVAADKRVLGDPAPSIVLSEITDSALMYAVRIWCAGSEYWNVKFDLTRAVKVAFDQHDIIVPHQQMDVHLAEKQEG